MQQFRFARSRTLLKCYIKLNLEHKSLKLIDLKLQVCVQLITHGSDACGKMHEVIFYS